MLGLFRGLAPIKQHHDACHRAHEYLEYYIKHVLSGTVSLQRNQIRELVSQTDDMAYIRSQILQGTMTSQGTAIVLVANTVLLLSREPDIGKESKHVVKNGDALFNFERLSTFPHSHMLSEYK
jgi:hypothetical protein